MTLAALALVAGFVAGALFGGLVMFKLGDRRGRDGIVDEMMAAELDELDEVERVWPRPRQRGGERRPS